MIATVRQYLRTLGLFAAVGLSLSVQHGCGAERATPGTRSDPATSAPGVQAPAGAKADAGVTGSAPGLTATDDGRWPDYGARRTWDAGVRCEPCTDPVRCCTPAALTCATSPPQGVTCVCERLWSCDDAVSTCSQVMIDGLTGSPWTCEIEGAHLVCTASAPATQPPAPLGAADPSLWRCVHLAAVGLWRCERQVLANPCNTAEGASEWSCATRWRGELVCHRM